MWLDGKGREPRYVSAKRREEIVAAGGALGALWEHAGRTLERGKGVACSM